MILHLLRMCRNVNRNVFNDRKNVSATAISIMPVTFGNTFPPMSIRAIYVNYITPDCGMQLLDQALLHTCITLKHISQLNSV